ncbi:hypothetical protein FAUST_8432 [Fusarium austroamericanum]|uniref:Uncharacterized protein n=1 Tax=Fusarium austroamericanum TaxID=282268 RepID=A0AAN6BXJ5_FUSAU|nr:hypothetical protein FAUST_8432 [Fusarium austroamericanum]
MCISPPPKKTGKAHPVAGPHRPPAGRPTQNPIQRPPGYQQVAAPRPVASRPVVGRQPMPNQGMQMTQMRRPQQQAKSGGPRPAHATKPGPPKGHTSRPQHVQHVQHTQHVHHQPVQQAGRAPAPHPAGGHAHKSGSSSNMKYVAGGVVGGAALGLGATTIYNQMNSSTNVVNQEHNSYSSENNNWQYDNYEQDNHYVNNSNYYDRHSSDGDGNHDDNYDNNYDPNARYESEGNDYQYDDQPGDYTQTPAQDASTGNNGGEEEDCCGDSAAEAMRMEMVGA